MVKSTDDLLIEAHPASSIAGCAQIETRLQSWGIDITLIGAENPDTMANTALPVNCLFSGPDADPSADRWADTRLPKDN